MFIDNKYTKWYFQIISNGRKKRELQYVEKHHIIPKCLGGSNAKYNIATLTPREHFLCHWLLLKMCKESKAKRSMGYAFSMMNRSNSKGNRCKSSLMFEIHRKNAADAMRGENNPFYGNSSMRGENNPFYGKIHTAETRAHISKMNKEYHKHNPNAFAGKKHSKETKKYLSEKANIGCVIVFLDGKETHVKNKISIGPVIGKSVSYGMKLTNEYNHLLKQNGIKEIRIL